ncbi:MAG: aminotransferase class I/II-fold pyridoxal phosphate-dependent enzyme [Gemmatales bacterium]|nr:aminotransferase class I/II-fold pyridoxal phosphate-dependent enzyme [Gemmatales bacterium]MDW8387082.1 GntG family PLP-dependent aldolase [Gemmatales bacterium]
MSHYIDLRSDTVTKPTPGMRAAMAAAEVGDDVFFDDPTVNRLQERVAELLGKEAALFVPSGTMSNQICLRAQTQPGDEIICEAGCHLYNYEAGGPAVLSGLMCRTVQGEHGILDVSQLVGLIRPDNEHQVRTRMVCLENTHNRGGGSIFPLEKIAAISEWARRNGLLMHLDGARLMNAVVATGVPAKTWASYFDSVSICFSKGLGAPIGSALAGTKEMVARARRIRKVLGGGMRQVGVLAAAALYALDHHVERLREDHDNAQILAQAVVDSPGVRLYPPKIETNILYMVIESPLPSTSSAATDGNGAGPVLAAPGSPAPIVANLLKQHGVLAIPTSSHAIRMVTHLDVSKTQVERAAEVIRKVTRQLFGKAAMAVG